MPLKSLKGKKRALKVRRRRKLARLYKLQKVQRDEEIEHEEEAAMVARNALTDVGRKAG
jgi:hypothetical protein